MQSDRIRIEPVAAALGAQIGGVDLTRPLDDPTCKAIHDAWMEHQVLFFRDQPIDLEQHKDFARHFGDLHIHPVLQPLKDEGHPEVVILESEGDKGYVASQWHSDVTFQHAPPLGSVLRCVSAPEVGGDTLWSSMYAAYEALSDSMQRLLSGLRALHTAGFFHALAKGGQKKDLVADDNASHPVIRSHPVTGRKGLFVNPAFTRSIVDMKPAESQALLGFLFDHVGCPDFTCRLRWRADTIAMWDNRCTQHRVIADTVAGRRRMERVTIVGDPPC